MVNISQRVNYRVEMYAGDASDDISTSPRCKLLYPDIKLLFCRRAPRVLYSDVWHKSSREVVTDVEYNFLHFDNTLRVNIVTSR